MALLWDIVGFLAKAAIIVVCVLVVLGFIAALVRRRREDGARLTVRRLNARHRDLANALRGPILGRKRMKRHLRAEGRAAKTEHERRVFVLDYHGDIAASATSALRNEITAIIAVAAPGDEVVLRLESSGGVVHGYGLAASQLVRLRERKLRLVTTVDKVAASGGYMMACVADELIAAPFAIIGSIGVVAAVPNAHRLLAEHGVDYEEMTAGEFKRTVSVLGEISPEGKKKFQEQLEDTHGLFKTFVQAHRAKLRIDEVSTGEYWFARRALELGLVDRLMTSDDYLLTLMDTAEVFHVRYRERGSWRRRVAASVGDAVVHAALALWSKTAARTPL